MGRSASMLCISLVEFVILSDDLFKIVSAGNYIAAGNYTLVSWPFIYERIMNF